MLTGLQAPLHSSMYAHIHTVLGKEAYAYMQYNTESH